MTTPTEADRTPSSEQAGEQLSDILAGSVGTLAPATISDRITFARAAMWKHWSEYCDWRRRLDKLERQQADDFRSKMDYPAATSQNETGPRTPMKKGGE